MYQAKRQISIWNTQITSNELQDSLLEEVEAAEKTRKSLQQIILRTVPTLLGIWVSK